MSTKRRTPTGNTVESFVTELNANDVLMGRGTPSAEYSGNLRFRQLVIERRPEYMRCTKRNDKHRVAQDIIATIDERGGRFLRRIATLEEAELLRVPPRKQAWKVIEPTCNSLFIKVKQLMRDVGEETQKKRKIRREEKREERKKETVHSSSTDCDNEEGTPAKRVKITAPSQNAGESKAGGREGDKKRPVEVQSNPLELLQSAVTRDAHGSSGFSETSSEDSAPSHNIRSGERTHHPGSIAVSSNGTKRRRHHPISSASSAGQSSESSTQATDRVVTTSGADGTVSSGTTTTTAGAIPPPQDMSTLISTLLQQRQGQMSQQRSPPPPPPPPPPPQQVPLQAQGQGNDILGVLRGILTSQQQPQQQLLQQQQQVLQMLQQQQQRQQHGQDPVPPQVQGDNSGILSVLQRALSGQQHRPPPPLQQQQQQQQPQNILDILQTVMRSQQSAHPPPPPPPPQAPSGLGDLLRHALSQQARPPPSQTRPPVASSSSYAGHSGTLDPTELRLLTSMVQSLRQQPPSQQ